MPLALRTVSPSCGLHAGLTNADQQLWDRYYKAVAEGMGSTAVRY